MKQIIYWAGLEESALELDLRMREGLKSLERNFEHIQNRASSDDDDEESNPVSVETVGGLAVLSIDGATISKSSWFSRYLGITSYEDIKERISEMADNPDVKAILLSLDTPGGHANGVSKLSSFIRSVSTKVKPIFTHADGSMASAGLWYGSAGTNVSVDPEGKIGSLGVIAVHMEYTKMLEEIGIKPTVFRTSPYKALGSPYEKLTEEAETEIKRELDMMHKSFVSAVASNRDLTSSYVQDKVATGRMFSAEESLALKLADHSLSLDEVVARLVKGLDNATAA